MARCTFSSLDDIIYPEGPPEHSEAEEEEVEENGVGDEEDEEVESGDSELRRKRKGKGGASQTKMVAAAMCVGIGSFSDPIEAQGLAHFLEHIHGEYRVSR
ncbi:unnamed protein product [Prunus armeniaca]|uniref:Peptidase M16 N-terminal domain-containing protein n=1 Tax=Prunus armeniaca TaxID=36596 RepID=A0A6J5UZF5_PRUAR|nr:unnamed protein product [Prunus armeniaca]